METLLACIERMTHGRERPQLELALAEALMTFLKVSGVRLHKCQETQEGTLVWVAVDVNRGGSIINDDGITTPDAAESVDNLPLIKTFIQSGLPDLADERILLPILMEHDRWFGFIEIDGDPLDVPQYLVAGQLVAVFKNMMALLEYSETDTLTGLLNRKTFDDYLLRILSRMSYGDELFAQQRRPLRRRTLASDHSHWLGIIDIDHFKRVNDTFGHSIGDEVLLTMGATMKKVFRTNDKLFRFGGEEFVVLLQPAEAEAAEAAFERMRVAIEALDFPLVGHVTISIGYAPIGATDQRTQIFDRADRALYWAKEHGRNQVASYPALVASGQLTEKKAAGPIEIYS